MQGGIFFWNISFVVALKNFNLMRQDLLRQCIRVEVGERLSLEAILGHPWLLPNASNDGSKIGPSSGLGGLPIPSREHGAKGISHPQVKTVNDHWALDSSHSQWLKVSKPLYLCSPWTAWAALQPSRLPRRNLRTRSGWSPPGAAGPWEETRKLDRREPGSGLLRRRRPRLRRRQGLLGLGRVARTATESR